MTDAGWRLCRPGWDPLWRGVWQASVTGSTVAPRGSALPALARDRTLKADAFATLVTRLSEAGQRQTKGWRQRLDGLERLRETLSYKSTLARGYAVVRGDGDVVTSVGAAKKAAVLEIEFGDGRMPVGGKAGPKKSGGQPEGQGSLF